MAQSKSKPECNLHFTMHLFFSVLNTLFPFFFCFSGMRHFVLVYHKRNPYETMMFVVVTWQNPTKFNTDANTFACHHIRSCFGTFIFTDLQLSVRLSHWDICPAEFCWMVIHCTKHTRSSQTCRIQDSHPLLYISLSCESGLQNLCGCVTAWTAVCVCVLVCVSSGTDSCCCYLKAVLWVPSMPSLSSQWVRILTW